MNPPEPLRNYGTACALRGDPSRPKQTSRQPNVLMTDLLRCMLLPTRCVTAASLASLLLALARESYRWRETNS